MVMKIVFWVLVIIVLVFLHALIGLYVDKFKVLKKEQITNWSLIPFTNMYLLGKHTFNRIVGVLLLIALFFVVDFTITIVDTKYGLTILNDTLRHTLFIVYFVITVFILVCSVRKYNVITKGKDTFKFDNIIYYIKETLWILALLVAIYLFVLVLSMFI